MMRRRSLTGLVLVAAVLLAGCATPTVPASDPAPVLRLSPASLGHELQAQQQLAVTTRGQSHRVDVLLEVDAAAVRLALVTFGQTAARLEWDGNAFTEDRAAWLPAAVSGERILSDLQLALWPEAAVRAALPPGWFLDATPAGRTLRQRDVTVVTVAYPSPSRITLDQRHDGYQLVIDTRNVGAAR